MIKCSIFYKTGKDIRKEMVLSLSLNEGVSYIITKMFNFKKKKKKEDELPCLGIMLIILKDRTSKKGRDPSLNRNS